MKQTVCDDLGMFLAHSAALEKEAAERFYELAAMMSVHNNDPLHGLFLELARYSVEHVNEVEAICQKHALPELKPWEYQWPDAEAPENILYEKAHYLMTPEEALKVVIEVEQGAEAFYQNVSRQTTDQTIRDYAAEFAAEEKEHAEAARRMLATLDGASHVDQGVDPDPPHMPE
jgi:rubrerythrin